MDLVKTYTGTQRSVKTDCYYTSLELAMELKKNNYTTQEQLWPIEFLKILDGVINKPIRWKGEDL